MRRFAAALRALPGRLFAHFEAYHRHGPLLMRYMSLLGLVGFPLLYALRYTRQAPAYDDFLVRLLSTALCLGVFLRDRWPALLKPYFVAYTYAVLIIILPLSFVFTSLKHGGGPVAVGNTFMAVFLLMLLADWRNMIVMLVVGFAAGGALYALTDPNPQLPMDYVARFPVLVAGLIGGSLFKFALDQATAERVRQAYASLAGSIAHEMRNPLAQVRYSLETIRQALPTAGVHAQPQVLDGAAVNLLYKHVAQGESAVKRGLQVIAMTLDEVNAKPLDPGALAYLSAAEVCAKAVEDYGYENEQQRARVRLVVSGDFVFRGDETAFLFVLFNLLKNALYYLPAYPEAKVEVKVDGGCIAVRDTGPGIAPDVMAKLFEPFRTSGKAGGSGLGLAYCRRVMQAFGGTIRCESQVGQYTEFKVCFPSVDSKELEAQRVAALADARKVFARRRLLLVDDDAALRAATRHKLVEVGCQIDEAADGHQAMQALQACTYDLVILDLAMPRMDGYELAEAVRGGRAPLNRDVCIVAHTSEPVHLARARTENAGMDGFVSKPCEQLALVHALGSAFEAAKLKRGRTSWFAGRHFLIADDSTYNRTAVGAYLKHVGAEVTEVSSGDAALHKLKAMHSCDAILLDIHMPGMDGLEAARAIRESNLQHRSVPILAITAHASPEQMASGRASGINEFVTKPIDAALLYEKLAQLMGIDFQALPVKAAPERAASVVEGLLDESRLQGYQRIGMLEELVEDYVPELGALIERLQSSVDRKDLQACLDALHSLMGMSGEAGARALYRFTREIYVPMLEQQTWPATSGAWMDHLRSLAADTNQALRDWTTAHAKVRA